MPVAHLLSQLHTKRFLTFWLLSWQTKNKKPSEVIIDESDALLCACVLAFTEQKTTNNYIYQLVWSLVLMDQAFLNASLELTALISFDLYGVILICEKKITENGKCRKGYLDF